MSRTTTWSAIGTDVSTATNVDEVLNAAKLDYIVEKQDLITTQGIEVDNRYATVAKYDDGSSRYLGIVGNTYNICQNKDAFGLMDDISEDLRFVKAGETHNGMVYLIGELPSMNILGDEITPHIILQNSHNNMFQLKSTIIPLRIVCQNQFNISFAESPNTIKIIHSSQLESKLVAARKILKGATEYMKTFEANAEFLAGIKTSREACMKIIDSYFTQGLRTENMNEKQLDKVQEDIARMKNAYFAEDNMNFQGTLYGLANAAADFITHKENRRTSDKSDDSRFLTITFDSNTLQNFIEFAKNKIVA